MVGARSSFFGPFFADHDLGQEDNIYMLVLVRVRASLHGVGIGTRRTLRSCVLEHYMSSGSFGQDSTITRARTRQAEARRMIRPEEHTCYSQRHVELD